MSDIFRDFDKNNEFPKVKLNLPKFDFSHLNEAVTNMNTIFDNIVKDRIEKFKNYVNHRGYFSIVEYCDHEDGELEHHIMPNLSFVFERISHH